MWEWMKMMTSQFFMDARPVQLTSLHTIVRGMHDEHLLWRGDMDVLLKGDIPMMARYSILQRNRREFTKVDFYGLQ